MTGDHWASLALNGCCDKCALAACCQVERCTEGMTADEVKGKIHETKTFQMLAGGQRGLSAAVSTSNSCAAAEQPTWMCIFSTTVGVQHVLSTGAPAACNLWLAAAPTVCIEYA